MGLTPLSLRSVATNGANVAKFDNVANIANVAINANAYIAALTMCIVQVIQSNMEGKRDDEVMDNISVEIEEESREKELINY